MSRRLVSLIAFGVIAAGTVMPASAQDRWDGADDLDVSPLTCGMMMATDDAMIVTEDPMMATDEAVMMGGMEYNGGVAVNPPDMAGQPIVLVDVPKLIGIGYFAATTEGMQQAAAELGNVTVTTDAPTEANIDDQIAVIDNYITQGVNGILFAANDPVAIAPVLQRALGQGIHVVGYDANSTPDAREWFINQAEFNGIAKAMVDNMAAEIGEDGSFAIVTSTFTTPNQSRWIAEMQAYQESCYPNMTWLATLEAQEDNQLSFSQATTLLNQYGEDLDGIFGMTSVATPATADAVTQAGMCGEVAVIGLATPNGMRPYVDSGCVKSVVLWNPVDLGYAAVYVMRAVVDGTLAAGDTSVEAGRLGTLQVVNGSEVLLGAPFIFNADNIADFDF